MKRNKAFWNSLGVLTVVVATAVVVSACGRNWCVAGLGPCEMFEKLDPNKKPKPYDPTNPCGWTSTGNPQNGLKLTAMGLIQPPLRVGQEIQLFANGGPKGGPYSILVKNNMGTFTPLEATNPRSWRFRATTVGFACIKVLDQGMGTNIDTACDECWLPLYVAPASATGTR